MRICFVYKQYHPNESGSGITTYISNLATKLSLKHQITILTTSSSTHYLQHQPFKVFAFKPFIGFNKPSYRFLAILTHNFQTAYQLSRLQRKYHFDLIEFANWEAEGLGYLFFINWIFKVPVVIRLHTPTLTAVKATNQVSRQYKMIHQLEKAFVHLTPHLISSTKAHWRVCQDLYNLRASVKIIPLGINLPPRHHPNLKPHLLFIGRPDKRKGVYTLIDSLPLVLKTYPKTLVTIVGTLNSAVLNYAMNKLSPSEFAQITFTDYLPPGPKLNHCYRQASICVLPSLYESFGLTIIEAMSHTLPVISTNVGGIPEIIVSGKNGLLVPPNDSSALAKSITHLLQNPTFAVKLGQAGYDTVNTKFSVNVMAQNSEKYYASLIRKN